jgi:hypothetical protein
MSSTSSATETSNTESSTPTTVRYDDKKMIESSPTNKPKNKIFYIKEDNGSFKQVGIFVKFGTEVKDDTVIKQTVYFSNNRNLPYVIGEHVFYTPTIGGGRRRRHTKHAAKSRRRRTRRVRKTRR